MKKAFTMAEAILVMAILGIIATIMISTLRPAEFKERALLIAAKKILEQIDYATQQILLNDSLDGTMNTLIDPDDKTFNFSLMDNCEKGIKLYKKYLVVRRDMDFTPTFWPEDPDSYHYIDDANSRYNYYYFLKDGSFFGISSEASLYENGAAYSAGVYFPYDTQLENIPIKSNKVQARILFDVNGIKEPNILGKDVFKIPLGERGIIYDF